MSFSPEDTIHDSFEDTLYKATEWLARLPDTRDASEAEDALADVFAWIGVVNERWADADAAPAFSRRQLASTGALSGDVIDKLRRWIKQLVAKLRDIVSSIPGAQSFSITSGVPPLALTVTFVPDLS